MSRLSLTLFAAVFSLAGCAEVILPIDNNDLEDPYEGCDARVLVTFDGSTATAASPGEVVLLEAAVENLTEQPLEIVVVDRCPTGLVTFDGLPASTDVYGTCMAGDCASFGESVVIEVEPGESMVVGADLPIDGDDCSAPLEPGTYRVQGLLELVDDAQPVVCSTESELRVE